MFKPFLIVTEFELRLKGQNFGYKGSKLVFLPWCLGSDFEIEGLKYPREVWQEQVEVVQEQVEVVQASNQDAS